MRSRRSFLRATAAALAAVPLLAGRRARTDLLVRGGTVIDGTGRPPFPADVAIAGDRITAVGPDLPRDGAEVLPAEGLIVAPGFVDIHSHGDGTLRQDPQAESVIRQGITTIVVGQDGTSRDGLLATVTEVRPAVNVATMVGLGSVRAAVMGDAARAASPAERARMRALVEQALAGGACGGSSGLEYAPGGYATTEELIEVARPLGRRGLPYATHLRNEDDRLLEALDEAVAVATGAGCPLQVSHLKAQGPRNWPRMTEALARLERAAAGGLDVAFDVYPYVAYQTGLTNLFPLWSRAGGADRLLARIESAATGARVREETLAKVELIGGWDQVMVSSVQAAADRWAEGGRVGTLAAARGADPYRLTVDLLRRSEGRVGMVGFAMSEANVERALAHPMAIVCSDGGAFAVEGAARQGHPHPRGLGSFPRVLGHYVRERGVLDLAAAVHRMTARPAARIGLADRGLVTAGAAADLVLFDRDRVTDRATFAEPFRYPDGIEAVLVNGTLTLRDGRNTGRAGRALRPRAAG